MRKWKFVPDRFNLAPVARDYWRLLRKYRTGERDKLAIAVLIGLPAIVFAACVRADFVFPAPAALLSAVALLSGVLLAAAGQIITLRARIADSLTLSTSARMRAFVRETMSGVVLAAVAALTDALVLGALAAATAEPDYVRRWWHTALTAVALTITTYLALMFVATARRLYTTYVEVFENGAPVRPQTHQKMPANDHQDAPL